MITMHRYGSLIAPRALSGLLKGDVQSNTISLDAEADLAPFLQYADILSSGGQLPPRTDADLGVKLHDCLHQLPRRVLLDQRFWQWLCVEAAPTYVTRRWYKGVAPADLDLSTTNGERFLGNQSLNGSNRNALARLFWVVELMQDGADDHQLSRILLSNQDLMLNLMEREQCLVTNVLRAATKELHSRPSKEMREVLKRIQLRASTVNLEALSEAEVIELMQ